MSTIEITAIEDLREGDYVTLRWEKSEGATVTLEGPMRFRAVGGYTITDARFVSATREVPEWEPGTVYEITTPDGDTEKAWCVRHTPDDTSTGFVDEDCTIWQAWELTSIKPLPDDAEALRRSLDVAREGYRKEAADWRARDTRMGAEVERLEAEVERLRAARQAPTRKRIVDAMWPDAPESARAGMTHLGMVDRVHALFEQDGAA